MSMPVTKMLYVHFLYWIDFDIFCPGESSWKELLLCNVEAAVYGLEEVRKLKI